MDKTKSEIYKTKVTKAQKKWNIRLTVSSEEEKRIKKEAIDNDMKVSDYVKFKLLGSPQLPTEGKLQ